VYNLISAAICMYRSACIDCLFFNCFLAYRLDNGLKSATLTLDLLQQPKGPG
jgi:hypothetical protein